MADDQLVPKPTNQLSVTVRSREKIVYDGPALAVSSVNDKGPFDILAQHANFISIMKQYLRIYKLDGTVQEFPIKEAILQVVENHINIFVGLQLNHLRTLE
jgi:F0F1-type ATP synthase epsilon subunit